MKESIITVILAVCSLIMVAAAGAGIAMEDRKAPKITLDGKNTLTYTEGDSEELLLKNMRAVDEKDGDVTESLRVSKIYVVSEGKAIVTYVAKDRANNIGQLKREVRYKAKKNTTAASLEAGLQWNHLAVEE